jgi:predicted nuclease of predicted toxin-antitoxin system
VRILLDACIPERFARFVTGHDVTTVRAFFGTTDLDDGPVLDRLTAHFDAFVTVDKNLRFQQNLRGRPFRIVLLRAHSNALENLVPLLPGLLAALAEMQPGDLRVVGV